MYNKFFIESPFLTRSIKTLAGLAPHSKTHLSAIELILSDKKMTFEEKILKKGTRVLMCNVLFNDDLIGDTRPLFLKADTPTLFKAKDELESIHRKMRANLIEFELKDSINCLVADGVHYLHLSVLEKKNVLSIPETIKELESTESKTYGK